jgi:adenine-specific DNA methylase
MGMDKFQPRYQVHEYPGRKPWYVVRKYIEEYSKQGEAVLEPFCGSGVIPCEALIARRKAIAVDIDPLAIFISRMTCISPVDLIMLEAAFARVEQAAKANIYDLYVLEDKCSVCGKQLVISSAARTPQGINVKASCSECNKGHELVYDSEDWKINTDESIPYWYLAGAELPEGIRGNI